MCRLVRYALNALTVLSLLLCVATVGLWVRSYQRPYPRSLWSSDLRWRTVVSRGNWRVHYSRVPGFSHFGPSPITAEWSLAGIAYRRVDWKCDLRADLDVPCRWVLLLCVLPIIARLTRYVLRRKPRLG